MTWARDAMEPDFTAGPIYDGEVCGRPFHHEPESTVLQVIFTAVAMLDRVAATDRDTVAHARSELNRRVDEHARTYGYTVVSVQSRTDPPMDSIADVQLRVEALLQERTDGEWPSIRAAIREDEVDREAARPPDGGDLVRARLAALKRDADWWTHSTARDRADAVSALPGYTRAVSFNR